MLWRKRESWPPDYEAIIRERLARIARIRSASPEVLGALQQWYREHPWEFVEHYAVTIDPRGIAKGKPAFVPFVPWPRQRALLEFLFARWRAGEPGTVVKSRDVGASWLTMAFIGTLMVLYANFAAGVASATEAKLDRASDPDTLFFKLREFLKNLPEEFRGGYLEEKHSSYLRVWIPATGSSCTGESGDAAGRGSRKSFYAVDESAHFLHPKATDAALSAATDCRIDLSSVNGTANSFYERAHNANIPRFDITWRDDLRKDESWYAERCRTLDPVIVAAELDCNFAASTEGQLIPVAWLNSAVGAREKLGLGPPSGARRAALDVGDQGRDKSAIAIRHGSELVYLESWSGKGSNIYRTTIRAFALCDEHGCSAFDFDADGLGSAVRGDAADINIKRREAGRAEVEAVAFRGSGAVFDPDGALVEGRANRDFFGNMKSQAYWALRMRFEATHRAVTEGAVFNEDEIISIDPELPELNQLLVELSQPAFTLTAAGKALIDKVPDGQSSPNLADATMMVFSPFQTGAYFGARPAGAVPGVGGAKVVPQPERIDAVFAVLAVVEDAAAVVFVGASRPGVGPELVVLGYDVRVFDEGAAEWLTGVLATVESLYASTHAKLRARLKIYVDDASQGWCAWLLQRGFPVVAVGADLPPPPARFGFAQPYVRVGHVELSQEANDCVVSFRGVRRNFLRELLATAAVPPESNPLAQCFATAVLMVFAGRPAVPPPQATAPEAWRPHEFAGARLEQWAAEAAATRAALERHEAYVQQCRAEGRPVPLTPFASGVRLPARSGMFPLLGDAAEPTPRESR